MKKRLNKIPTNYSVALTEQEVVNLSETLSAVRTAGGGTGGVYVGDGKYIGVDNTNNRISFLPDAATKLESVSGKLDKSTYAADSATYLTAHQSLSGYYTKTDTSSKEQLSTEFEKYQTVAGMDQYLTELEAQATYLTKSSADNDYAPLSTTADIEALKAASGDFSEYYTKNETYSKNEVYTKEDVYQKTETSSKSELENAFIGVVTDSELETAIGNVNQTIYNLQDTVEGKQDILTFGKDGTGAISSINSTALAGQGGTTYSAGAGIAIVDEYISLSADYIQAITQVSGKQDELEFTYDNSGSIIKINNSAIAGGAGGSVSYTGRNGVEINGNYIELETTAKNAIDSVAGISTDVGTLKTASADWDKVSDKLDTTAFSTVSGTFLTEIPDAYATTAQLNTASSTLTGVDNDLSGHINYVSSHAITSLDDYYTKTQVDSTFASATQLNDYLTTAQYQTYSGTFALKSEIPTTVAQLTDSANYYKTTETSSKNELSTEFAKYVTSSNVSTQDANYVMTTSGWKVLTLPGGGMTQVIHDETLTGQGNDANSKLGVVWSALSGNTINSALSAGSATSALSAENAESARYTKQLKNASKSIEVNDITALQYWASSNSSTWDTVSAKLGTAQYSLDSATFVTSSNASISADGEQYALTTTGWAKVQAGSTLTAGSGVEIVSNGINTLLGTDLAFNATTSAIQINTNGTVYGAYAFVEGSNTTASGAGAHAEGADAGAIGQGAHAGGYGTHTTGVGNFIHGTFLNFASPDGTTNSNTPVFVGGTLNATTAQDYTDNGGYLQIMGNGTYTGDGRGNNSDAYILYRDGTVSAKQFQNADGTETINGTTYNFSGVDNIEILPNAATANTANFPNDNVLRFILES